MTNVTINHKYLPPRPALHKDRLGTAAHYLVNQFTPRHQQLLLYVDQDLLILTAILQSPNVTLAQLILAAILQSPIVTLAQLILVVMVQK